MSRPIAFALLGSLALVLSGGHAAAGDGGPHGRPGFHKPLTGFNPHDGFRGRRVFHRPFPGFDGHHGFRRPHRSHAIPALHGGRSGDVNVLVRQTVVFAQPLPAVPSIRDLPVSAGIREAVPAQPTVIVVNERTGVGEPVLRTLSQGPKIIEVGPRTQAASAPAERAPAFGARIVQVSIPSAR